MMKATQAQQNGLNEFYQKAKIAIDSIKYMELQQMTAFQKPPSYVQDALRLVQIALSGYFAQIDLNPATNYPKHDSWQGCRKMACKNSHEFLVACMGLFQRFDNDPYLDSKIEHIVPIFRKEENFAEKMKKYCLVVSKLLIWLQNLIKYWEIRRLI